MAPAPGDNKIYGNWVSMRVGEGLTPFIIRQCFGNINRKDDIKGN